MRPDQGWWSSGGRAESGELKDISSNRAGTVSLFLIVFLPINLLLMLVLFIYRVDVAGRRRVKQVDVADQAVRWFHCARGLLVMALCL